MPKYIVGARIEVDDVDEAEAVAHVVDMIDSYGKPGPFCQVTDPRCLAIERPVHVFSVGIDPR